MNERWQRLADSLTAAGIPATVSGSGESRSIALRLDGVRVEIHDKWWSRNLDKWIGWQVHTETSAGYTVRVWPITKKRSEVVAHVTEASA
jgi:hypothetical protein